MKLILTALLLLTTLSSAFALDIKCKGDHFLNSTVLGGNIKGDCSGKQGNLDVNLEYKINTYGIGFGASTHHERTLKLELNDALVQRLKQKGVLDLEVCNGGSVEIGYIGGVSYSKICAREMRKDFAKACLTFSDGLLYSGVGVHVGASCERFRLEVK